MSLVDIIESEPTSSTPPVDWESKGACVGLSHLFFAPDQERPPARERRELAALAVCNSCVVLDECREYILTHEEYGFWAGYSENDRHSMGLPLPAYLKAYYDRDRRRA